MKILIQHQEYNVQLTVEKITISIGDRVIEECLLSGDQLGLSEYTPILNIQDFVNNFLSAYPLITDMIYQALRTDYQFQLDNPYFDTIDSKLYLLLSQSLMAICRDHPQSPWDGSVRIDQVEFYDYWESDIAIIVYDQNNNISIITEKCDFLALSSDLWNFSESIRDLLIDFLPYMRHQDEDKVINYLQYILQAPDNKGILLKEISVLGFDQLPDVHNRYQPTLAEYNLV